MYTLFEVDWVICFKDDDRKAPFSVVLGPLEAGIGSTWTKFELFMNTRQINVHTMFEVDWVTRFPYNGRKPPFADILGHWRAWIGPMWIKSNSYLYIHPTSVRTEFPLNWVITSSNRGRVSEDNKNYVHDSIHCIASLLLQKCIGRQ